MSKSAGRLSVNPTQVEDWSLNHTTLALRRAYVCCWTFQCFLSLSSAVLCASEQIATHLWGAPCACHGVSRVRWGLVRWGLQLEFLLLICVLASAFVYLQLLIVFQTKNCKGRVHYLKTAVESSVICSCFLLLATSAVEIGPQSFKAAACLRKCCWIKAPCSATLPLLFLHYQLCQPSSKEEDLALKWI